MVRLNNMEFYAYHGCLDSERREGNRFRVDFAYDYDMRKAARSDELREAIDYGVVYDIIKDYDFIIDGTDNFPAKFLINDACVLEGKPYSHAGVLQFRGQTTTYIPNHAPCLRCIFPYSSEHSAPSCDTAGVIGGVCGVIGTLQAMEAVKYIVGAGELLAGRLLVYNALKSRFHEVCLPPPDGNCPVCGNIPSITQPIDLETCSRRLLFRQTHP